jgi:GAF domain-containing protein
MDTGLPWDALAAVARLEDGDEDPAHVLRRVAEQARDLVPGCTGACLTVVADGDGLTAAVTDERVGRCHAAQFREGGEGPAPETLRHGEPRHVQDLATEQRWPRFTEVARGLGFASCLCLPLLTDRTPAAALNLYADRPGTFRGTTFDVALLLAAEGGVALDNSEVYRRSHESVEHLHRTLATRGVIERAKGLLMHQHGLTGEQAFDALRTRSQHTDRTVPEVAEQLLRDHAPGEDPATTAWTPTRRPSWGGAHDGAGGPDRA